MNEKRFTAARVGTDLLALLQQAADLGLEVRIPRWGGIEFWLEEPGNEYGRRHEQLGSVSMPLDNPSRARTRADYTVRGIGIDITERLGWGVLYAKDFFQNDPALRKSYFARIEAEGARRAAVAAAMDEEARKP